MLEFQDFKEFAKSVALDPEKVKKATSKMISDTFEFLYSRCKEVRCFGDLLAELMAIPVN